MSIRNELTLNTNPFVQGIRRADAALAGFNTRAKAFSGQFAAIAGVLAGVVAHVLAFKSALDLGGEMTDLSANTGEQIADLVVLKQAFENAGLGADGVGGALAKLQKALSGVNEEGQPTTDAFNRLGLSIHTLREMNATEQLASIGQALAALPNQADKTRAAMEIFGKSGAKMLALLSDPAAMQTAREQVGELGHTLQANAGTFDTISDNIGALHTKFEQFATGAVSQLTESLKGPSDALAKMDLTEAGRGFGKLVASIVELFKIVWKLMPLWVGLGTQFLNTALKAKLAGTVLGKEFPNSIAGARQALTELRASMAAIPWTSFKSAGVGAFNGIKSAVKGLLSALGPIGAAMVIFDNLIKPLIENAHGGSADQWKDFAGATRNIGGDSQGSFNRSQKTYKNVANEEERYSAMKGIEGELDSVKERIAAVGTDYADLSQEQQASLVGQLKQWQLNLEIVHRQLSELPPEILRARAAEHARAAALEESRKKAEELHKAVAKGIADLDQAKADDYFNTLSAAQQKANLLTRTGGGTMNQLDTSISALKSDRAAGRMSDADEARLMRLLEIRKQLVGIERKIAEEKQKQLDADREAAKNAAEKVAKNIEEHGKAMATRQKYERDFALDMRKMIGEATGDTKGAEQADRQRRYYEARDAAIAAGLTAEEANRNAITRVQIEDEKAKAEKKAGENGGQPTTSVVADSIARIGGGGYAALTRHDPQLKAERDNTRETKTNNELLKKLNSLLSKTPAPISLTPKFT